ncbi:DUF6631 family protein [Pseudoxanthomonas winnipegensis]|uniref:Uncharacterized protein n=1 Tax=Pseudoxanthomonas winnipegensis TaxID=2480810 RepID=A0A4Q8M7V9_9GAMM|nr:DUF6631 family protein [Pseudoxanthomonas winnipegensis]TAA45642.1 hypothetical protein EA655_05495 [Pseudoxanthomonas winnipegensis]
MARKVERPAPSPAVGAGDSLVELHPNITITVAGRAVTVREYGFFEGLEVAARCPGFIASLGGMCAAGTLAYARVRRLFGLHRTEVINAAAVSTGQDPEWIERLDGADAELLMSTWFGVTGSFFVHEAVQELVELQPRPLASTTPISGTASSPSSPPPASATSTSSASAPNGS